MLFTTVLRTTPTISRSVGSPWKWKRLPTTFSLGQKCLAMASLAMATGLVVARSESVNSRPSMSGMRRVSKNVEAISYLRQRAAVSGSFILALRENGARKCWDQRRSIGDGSGLYTGRRFGACDGCAEELLAVPFVVVQSAEIEIEHEEVGGFEAGVDALRVLHAANEKAGAN